MDAAKFLKKSGLSDVVLSRVSTIFFYGRCLRVIFQFFKYESSRPRHVIALFIVLGVGLVWSEGSWLSRQARIIHRIEARLAGSNGRKYQREELTVGASKCSALRWRSKDETSTSTKNDSTDRNRLVNQASWPSKVSVAVPLTSAGKWRLGRRQSCWNVERVEIAGRHFEYYLGACRSGQGRQLGWTWVHCGKEMWQRSAWSGFLTFSSCFRRCI